ncbi:hypothetical protein N7540_003738 [Penicillium herquei]|nr:hypothetical protein N7540_003738 [Penicillium herquei]
MGDGLVSLHPDGKRFIVLGAAGTVFEKSDEVPENGELICSVCLVSDVSSCVMVREKVISNGGPGGLPTDLVSTDSDKVINMFYWLTHAEFENQTKDHVEITHPFCFPHQAFFIEQIGGTQIHLAFDSLDENRQKLVSQGQTGSTTDAINGVINQTREKYTEWQKSGLKVKGRSGDDLNIRDGAEKILNAALQAQDLITDIAAFDPTGRAENLAYYTLVDTHYRDHQVDGGQNFDRALVQVYTGILDYTAEVIKVQQESKLGLSTTIFLITTVVDDYLGRIVISVKSIDEQHLTQLKAKIEAQQAGDRARAQKILDDVDESLAVSKKVYSRILNEEEGRIMAWVSSFDYWVPYHRTQEYRTPDTGTWLLDSQEYRDWKVFPGSVLWLPGVVGCGKSVLCSTIIKDIEELCKNYSSKSLGYWYFEGTQHDSQSVEMMMMSLIRQLSQSPLRPSVRKCWGVDSKKGARPSRETITTILDDVFSDMPSDVFLVLDALDECPTNGKERPHLLSLLVGLAEVHKKNIHILATSRPEQDIKASMENFPSINLEEKQGKDVETFVLATLEEEELQDADADIKSSIVDALLNTGERRFRWADLQLKRFKDCLTDEDIRAALRTTPKTLEETYQDIVDKIKRENNQSFARQMLMLCAFAAAPLDLETVRSSVSLRSRNFVISICTTSLLAVSNDIVRLAHFSVKEFLVVPNECDDSEGCRFSETAAHEILAQKTIALLLKQTEELTEETAIKHHFLVYTANHWPTHVAALGDISLWPVDLPEKVDRLFTEPMIFLNWTRIAERGHGSIFHWSRIPRYSFSPINLATKWTITGKVTLNRTVRLLVDQCANPMDDGFWSPILVIASHGDLELLDMLLKKDFPVSVHLCRRILVDLSLGNNIKITEASKIRLRTVLNTMRKLGFLYDSWRGSVETPVGQITERTLGRDIVCLSLLNKQVDTEILRQLLDWRDMGLISFNLPSKTIHMVSRCQHRDEVLDLLFGNYKDEIPISKDILGPVSGTVVLWKMDTDMIVYIMLRKPAAFNIQGPSLSSMAQHLSTKQMELVLQSFPDIYVTESALVGAAKNSSHQDMLGFLWPRRERNVSITEDILVSAAINSSPVAQQWIIHELGSDIQFNDCVMEQLIEKSRVPVIKTLWESQKITVEISAKMIEIAILRPDDPVEMLQLLDSFGTNSKSAHPITESLVFVAAGHPKYASSLISYLSRMQEQPIPITEKAFVNALMQSDPSVANKLMDKCLEVPLTDHVFIAACHNPLVLSRLLDKRSDFLPVNQMVAKFAIEEPPTEVLDMLFDRKLLGVDEELLEAMAGRYETLFSVLSQAPHMPIADKVLLKATRDSRSLRLLLEKRSIDNPIAEDIIIAFTENRDSDQLQQVVEAIINRIGPAPLTKKVFLEVLKHFPLSKLFPWLCA